MRDQLNAPELPDCIPRLGNRLSRALGRSFMRVLGWKFEGQFPQQNKFVMAVAPHTSNWDFTIGMAAVMALNLKLSFLAKHSIFVPPFAGIIRKLGGIPVERSRAHGVVEQLVERYEQSDALILGIAPEGTRSKVTHWKSGFLQIANQAQVPVLLLYFDFKKKVVGFGPLIDISDDLEGEMAKVQAFYATIHPKNPELA